MKKIDQVAKRNLSAFIILFVSFCFTSNAQNDKGITKFKITFENTDSGLDLKCTEGCAWQTLSLKSDGNSAGYKIDGYGIVTGEKSNQAKLPTFGFMVKKSGNEVMLIGMNGTSWKNITFPLLTDKTVSVDEKGKTK